MRRRKYFANVVVGHLEIGDLIEQCPQGICTVIPVNVSSLNLGNFSSNQISESRAFLLDPGQFKSFKFVGFTSINIETKTNSNINIHSACNLISSMSKNQVLSPYVMKSTVQRLLNPVEGSPGFAFKVPRIYRDIIDLELKQLSILKSPNEVRILPFCNSFIASKETYLEFNFFIREVIEKIWDRSRFQYPWFNDWESDFHGRETGLMIERITALWFGSQIHLEVMGPHWGQKYPSTLKLKNGWRDANSKADLDLTN